MCSSSRGMCVCATVYFSRCLSTKEFKSMLSSINMKYGVCLLTRITNETWSSTEEVHRDHAICVLCASRFELEYWMVSYGVCHESTTTHSEGCEWKRQDRRGTKGFGCWLIYMFVCLTVDEFCIYYSFHYQLHWFRPCRIRKQVGDEFNQKLFKFWYL